MQLPSPRGPFSACVMGALREAKPLEPAPLPLDVLGDDAQIALWTLTQLHLRGFDEVEDDREWAPDVVVARQTLARIFERRLRGLVAPRMAQVKERAPGDLEDQVMTLVECADGPPLAAFLHRQADRDQVLDFLRQRSVYHLKESDAHAFLLPRLHGAAKVALAELQYDEFGAGRPERLHAALFADAMDAAGLDPAFGAYVDEVGAPFLAVDNLITVLALQRRLRAASAGQLAAFEATSSLPCRKIAMGIERVGLPPAVAAYFHEHVEADAVHEQVAVRDICRGVVDEEPDLADDVLFGAAAYLDLDARAAADQLERWGAAGPQVVAS